MRKPCLLLLLAALAIATGEPPNEPVPAPVEEPAQPLFPAVRDSVEQVPLFRPRVVIRQEVIIPKDPFLGGALSLVLPGTGQAYSGQWLRGIGFLTGTLLCYGLGGGANNSIAVREGIGEPVKPGEKVIAGALVIAGLTLHALSVIDGVNTANAHNRLMLDAP
ncbi:hypothetical protein JXB37_05975 [candidate division WOR-3 bacterium]|nr:hypothetical protein [candidate division WOR-3 bacterium]